MKYFKEILHLGENIYKGENRDKVKRFQKSINYRWNDKYKRPWEDNILTNEIIEKTAETKGFTKEYDNVGELVSSNEESDELENLSEEDENFEMILRNYWLENGYEVDISEIKRIINFGVNNEIMKTKEFMSSYMTIKELDDEGVKEEIRMMKLKFVIIML
jgi:hypothetical protein